VIVKVLNKRPFVYSSYPGTGRSRFLTPRLFIMLPMSTGSANEIKLALSEFVNQLHELKSIVIDVNNARKADKTRYQSGQRVMEERSRLLRHQDMLSLQLGRVQPVVQRLVGLTQTTDQDGSFDAWMLATGRGNGLPHYSYSINVVIQNTLQAIGYIEGRPLRDKLAQVSPETAVRPKIFISHDGDSALRTSLTLWLFERGTEPRIVERDPESEVSIDDKIAREIREADFAIVLGRMCAAVQQDDAKLPRGSVIDEITRIRDELGGRYLILLEAGMTLPSSQSSGATYKPYQPDQIDKVLLYVTEALIYHGIPLT
jgi:predicted nucleotide-binding protein